MTRLLDILRRGLSAAAFCAAFMLAAMETLADDPAPAAQEAEVAEPEDEGAPEKSAEEEPEPEPSKGEKLFAEAFAAIQEGRATGSTEAFAEGVRKARAIFEQIANLPEADANEEVRTGAAAFHDQTTVALIMHGTDEEKKAFFPQMVEKAVAPEEIGGREYGLMSALLASAAETDPKLAEETMAKFRTAIEAKGGEGKEDAIAELEGAVRRATLIGNKLVLAGTTFEGKKFDIADLKGKVVLVDFWATWCPPCRAEHPNMLTNYRKYQEKGFEIVGVSLDQDREALKEFLDESEGHWIILHDGMGENPATTYYAIQGIPAMFLLDEEGVVISTEARGEELTRLLEERFGKVELPAEEEGEKETPEEEEKPETKEESDES